jgi:hypothetical protein
MPSRGKSRYAVIAEEIAGAIGRGALARDQHRLVEHEADGQHGDDIGKDRRALEEALRIHQRGAEAIAMID